MRILYELRKTTQRTGPVRLVSQEELGQSTGFRSIYGFCEEAIKHIQDTKTTAGLRGFELYSDVLLVDFDNQPEAADKFELYLMNMGTDVTSATALQFILQIGGNYKYEKYDSGGRSIHFHVPLEPMQGSTIPESQKEWMKKIAPLADMSVYKTSGMFRLTGTFHHKNRGQYKRLITKEEGQLLSIPMIQVVEYKINSIDRISTEDSDLEYILMRLLVTKVVEGTIGRNNHLFKMAAICRDMGIGSNECEHLVHIWNSEYCTPPLQGTGIKSTINSAYRKVV